MPPCFPDTVTYLDLSDVIIALYCTDTADGDIVLFCDDDPFIIIGDVVTVDPHAKQIFCGVNTCVRFPGHIARHIRVTGPVMVHGPSVLQGEAPQYETLSFKRDGPLMSDGSSHDGYSHTDEFALMLS